MSKVPVMAASLEALLSPAVASALKDRPSVATDAFSQAGTSLPPVPPEPTSITEAGLTEGLVDSLVLKVLLQSATATGAQLAARTCLPRRIVGDTLARLRDELQVTIKGAADQNDYHFQLSEAGAARAKQHSSHANYADAAPVPLEAYERAIRRQSTAGVRVTLQALRAELADLTLGEDLVSLVAQALSDGRGLFLYGAPGNGKTTIAERICGVFGKHLWIPRAVSVGTDILRVFDATVHEPILAQELESARYDRRWVLIKRPTVVVGGELTLDQLEPSYHASSGISEAPVQMKANGGALVIDDFGRQRASSTEILNRLIVPLEKHYDYLSLASGRQARVPFDLLFVVSTNLEPRALVDEAFLRRIPYKVEARDPTEAQFRALFGQIAAKLGLALDPTVLDKLLAEQYAQQGRPMRFCHPRDLLRQAKNYCAVHDREPLADAESLGAAVRNYFAGI
ncbi:MAG: AAA family ATPase [Lacipirellulaceae bacterium]